MLVDPELDAKVAEKVFGMTIFRRPHGPAAMVNPTTHSAFGIPPYSTKIVDAWLVVERMLDVPDQAVFLAFMRHMNASGWCAPVHIICPRICEAALAALEG